MGYQVVAILISVFAGILTYLIITILKQTFNKIILPWYQANTYKGLDISGVWSETHNYEGIITQDSEIIVNQNAHSIKGTITLAKKNDHNEVIEVKTFNFEGEYYNNFLNITCWNQNKRQIGTHNYLMRIERDGAEMDGYKTYYDIGMKKLRSEEIFWARK